MPNQFDITSQLFRRKQKPSSDLPTFYKHPNSFETSRSFQKDTNLGSDLNPSGRRRLQPRFHKSLEPIFSLRTFGLFPVAFYFFPKCCLCEPDRRIAHFQQSSINRRRSTVWTISDLHELVQIYAQYLAASFPATPRWCEDQQ